MPRQYQEGKVKRKDEVNIQGWFSSSDPDENAIIELFKEFRFKHGLTNKQGIMACAAAYLEAHGYERPSANDGVHIEAQAVDAIQTLFGLIQELRDMPIGYHVEDDGETLDTRRVQVFDELDAIQQSIGSRYKSIPLDEDDE